MKTSALKTKRIMFGDSLLEILEESLTRVPENSIVAITSNIVSLCEKRVVKIGTRDKLELIEEQADYFLPPSNTYNISLTIKQSVLIPSAGIDESNTNGFYTLWPKDSQKTANEVRDYLKKKFQVKHVGVIIVDSKTTPLRWGVTGVSIAHSGFAALNDYSGTPDLFGRIFQFEKANIADALAGSAVLVMGEGSEQTPLAILEDVPFVTFHNRNPTQKELQSLTISMETDVFGEILTRAPWKNGGHGK